MKCFLDNSNLLEEISSLFSLLFSSVSLHGSLRKAFLSLLAILWNSAFSWIYRSFSPLLFTFAFHLSAICKALSDNHFAFLHFFFLGMVWHVVILSVREGIGNPLQYSCLGNPRDGGAWWAAVYGVAQSWTWLKRLSSSSSILSVLFFSIFCYLPKIKNLFGWILVICSVQLLSRVQLFATQWITACQASLSIMNSLQNLDLNWRK